MPTLDAPGHFERTDGEVPQKFDRFFKWAYVEADTYTGDVECPIGVVSLLKLDNDAIEDLEDRGYAAGQNFHASEVPFPGWYLVRTDSNGLIWAMAYGELDSTYNEERCRADYAEADQAYSRWMELSEFDV